MLEFQGNFSGVTAILFPPESAAALVALLSGEDDPKAEMDAIRWKPSRKWETSLSTQ